MSMPIQVLSQSMRDIVINEIAWMGTAASSTDEWIELYNPTSASIDVTGWTLAAADGEPAITLSGSVPSHGFFLLERSDENTVLDIVADQIYTGNLSNSGESLTLKTGAGQEIDEVPCASGWFAGSSTSKATMERKHHSAIGSAAESWDTNNTFTVCGHDAGGAPLSGTPKMQNSVFDYSLSVQMLSFSAASVEGHVVLKWSTASETGHLGFYVQRSDHRNGPFSRISVSLIQGAGTGSSGAKYEYTDVTAETGRRYWYQIEEVAVDGGISFHGPVPVENIPLPGPGEFRLDGNYPNPFNPNTTIRYSIPEGVFPRTLLTIYNTHGQEVATLVDRCDRPGLYDVPWNGCDASGAEVSSGRYFYRLFSGGTCVDVKAMLKLE